VVRWRHRLSFLCPFLLHPNRRSLYVFGASGSITGQLRKDGVVVTGPTTDLGVVRWSPPDNGFTHLWALGAADRMSSEFRLGRAVRAWKRRACACVCARR